MGAGTMVIMLGAVPRSRMEAGLSEEEMRVKIQFWNRLRLHGREDCAGSTGGGIHVCVCACVLAGRGGSGSDCVVGGAAAVVQEVGKGRSEHANWGLVLCRELEPGYGDEEGAAEREREREGEGKQ